MVNGHFILPALAGLSSDDQQFIIEFVKKSGSLKEMSKSLGFSYPTVRNILNDLIERVISEENQIAKNRN